MSWQILIYLGGLLTATAACSGVAGFLTVMVWRVLRRSVHQSPVMEIASLSVDGLPSESIQTLMKLGEWLDFDDGAFLTVKGQHVRHLHLIQSGRAKILEDGREIAIAAPGTFIGEIALLEQSVATATVQCAGPVRSFALPLMALRRVMREDTAIDAYLNTRLAVDLAAKLLDARARMARTRAAA
jgi:CRP-like cAMP-binding protein